MTEQDDVIIGAMKAAFFRLRNSCQDTDYEKGIKYGVCLGYAGAFDFSVMARLHLLAQNAATYAQKDALKEVA